MARRFASLALSLQGTVYIVDMLDTGFSDRPPAVDYRMVAAASRLLSFVKEVWFRSARHFARRRGRDDRRVLSREANSRN
jgi:hypothetical protein